MDHSSRSLRRNYVAQKMGAMLKYRQRNELRHITGYATEWALCCVPHKAHAKLRFSSQASTGALSLKTCTRSKPSRTARAR